MIIIGAIIEEAWSNIVQDYLENVNRSELIQDLPSSVSAGNIDWVKLEKLNFLHQTLFNHKEIKSTLSKDTTISQPTDILNSSQNKSGNTFSSGDFNSDTLSTSKSLNKHDNFTAVDCFKMFAELDSKSLPKQTQNLTELQHSKSSFNFIEDFDESQPSTSSEISKSLHESCQPDNFLQSLSTTITYGKDFFDKDCYEMLEHPDTSHTLASNYILEDDFDKMLDELSRAEILNGAGLSTDETDKIHFADYSEYKQKNSLKDLNLLKKKFKERTKCIEKKLQSLASTKKEAPHKYKMLIEKASDKIDPQYRKACFLEMKDKIKNLKTTEQPFSD